MISDVKSNRSDRELARLVAGGDAAAFEEIHGRYRQHVYALALRLTGNVADAEDVTQDSFVSLLRGVGSFRGEAAFSTWLYRLVANQVKMHFRRRKSRPEGRTIDVRIPELKPGGASRAEAERVVDRLAIDEAARGLAPGYRAAFILHEVAGYEHTEVARLMGWETGTSKSQLHKARARLREMLLSPSPALQT